MLDLILVLIVAFILACIVHLYFNLDSSSNKKEENIEVDEDDDNDEYLQNLEDSGNAFSRRKFYLGFLSCFSLHNTIF